MLTISTLFIKCGVYSFSGSTIPAHIKTVAVPLFEDRTSEFGIDQQLTDLLLETISQDNTLKIGSARDADSMLKGVIERVTDDAGVYDQAEQVSSFRITISIKVTFEDLKKKKVLWEETWSQWGRFDYADISREDGIKEAVEKLSIDILNHTVSGW